MDALGGSDLRDPEDAVRVLDAGGRQAVREEDDRAGALAVEQVERAVERSGDVRPAAGSQVLEVADSGVRLTRRVQAEPERAHAAREAHDREPVVRSEVVEDVGGGVDRLLHLLALHRAGGVEDKHDVARHDLVDLDDGREQQREVAVLAGKPVRQQPRVDQALAAGEVEPEVRVRRPRVVRFPADVEAARADALDIEVEAGRERGADLPRDVDVDGDRRRGGARRHSRPRHLDEGLVILGQQRRGHRERDLALLASGHGEGAHLVEVVGERAQQRRVDQPPHDVLVDAGRLVGVEDAALEGLRPAGEHEVGHGAARRDREHDPALGAGAEVLAAGGVAEMEAVARDHHAVADLDLGLQLVELRDGADRPPAVLEATRRDRAGLDLLREGCRRQQLRRDQRRDE